MRGTALLGVLLALGVTACGAPVEGETIASEELALPVTASAPCIQARCDAATCNGTLTIAQTVPVSTGHVELWDASQQTATASLNWTPITTLTQSPGSIVTTTRLTNFRQGETFCLLTGVVTRNAAGNVVGSAPVLNNGQLSLQPSAVTATVTP
jgi:hypothetical protein